MISPVVMMTNTESRERCARHIRLYEYMGNKTAARIARAEWQKIYTMQLTNGEIQRL